MYDMLSLINVGNNNYNNKKKKQKKKRRYMDCVQESRATVYM